MTWSKEAAAREMERGFSGINLVDRHEMLKRHLAAAFDAGRRAVVPEVRASPAMIERVRDAIGSTPLLVPGTLRDLLCTTTYANDHVVALLLRDAAICALAALDDAPRAGSVIQRLRNVGEE